MLLIVCNFVISDFSFQTYELFDVEKVYGLLQVRHFWNCQFGFCHATYFKKYN